MNRRCLVLVLSLAPLACRSNAPQSVGALDEGLRASLLASVRSLEGTWDMTGPDGQPATTQFQVSSNGSVVREVMFPGTSHEMTNMYHLDGNALCMTHYCAIGNQPHLRAERLEGGRIAFRLDEVTDLKAPDETYMGELTLELVDADHFKGHWRAFSGTRALPDHEMHFQYTRRK